MGDLGRFGDEWLSLLKATSGAAVCDAFGLPYPIDPEGEHFAASLALIDLGVCMASVFAEPRLRRNHAKAARDAQLARDTLHLAPVWRHADADETGNAALILPVGYDGEFNRTLSLHLLGDLDFATSIADLIAIPLDGSRPLSATGFTKSVGCFNVEHSRLVMHAGGIAFLKAHLDRARKITADTPSHLIPRLHFPLPPPDDITTLLIEPLALEWRVTAARCVIPHAARELIVSDSLKLAAKIDGLMRMKEKTRSLPVVRGPKREAAA